MNGPIRERGKRSWELTIELGKDSGDQRVPSEAKEAQL